MPRTALPARQLRRHRKVRFSDEEWGEVREAAQRDREDETTWVRKAALERARELKRALGGGQEIRGPEKNG